MDLYGKLNSHHSVLGQIPFIGERGIKLGSDYELDVGGERPVPFGVLGLKKLQGLTLEAQGPGVCGSVSGGMHRKCWAGGDRCQAPGLWTHYPGQWRE